MYKEIAIMPNVKIGAKHQVVIPHGIFHELGLRIGDIVEAVKEGNNIVFKPQTLIPKEDAWFHTKEWQEGEKQADKDFANGDVVGPFDNIKDALKALKTTKI